MRYKGKIISAAEGLRIAGLKPLELEAKEGLALLNGLQASTAIAISALFHSKKIDLISSDVYKAAGCPSRSGRLSIPDICRSTKSAQIDFVFVNTERNLQVWQ